MNLGMQKYFLLLIAMLGCFIAFGAKAPGKPRGLTSVAISCNEVELSWKGGAHDSAYEVYNTSGDFVVLVAGNKCVVTGLKPVTTYAFMVRAIKAGQRSEFAISDKVITQLCKGDFHWRVNNYPFKFTGNCDNKPRDPFYFDMFSCASYVAWKINNLLGDTTTAFKGPTNFPFNDFMNGGTEGASPAYCNSTDPKFRLSNACHWAIALKRLGYKIDNIPAVGAIAQWDAFENDIGSHGHVAFVDSISGTQVFLSNYNGIDNNGRDVPCRYGYFKIDTAKPYNKNTNRLPGRFIHIDRVRKME
jgi:hypothetical protein